MLCLWRFHIFGSKGVLSLTRGRCRRHVWCHKGLMCKTSHFPKKWRKQNKSKVNFSRVWSWRQMLITRKHKIRSRRCFSERDQVWCFDEQIIQHFYSVTKNDSRFIKLKVKAHFGFWPDTKIRNLSNSKHHQKEVLLAPLFSSALSHGLRSMANKRGPQGNRGSAFKPKDFWLDNVAIKQETRVCLALLYPTLPPSHIWVVDEHAP